MDKTTDLQEKPRYIVCLKKQTKAALALIFIPAILLGIVFGAAAICEYAASREKNLGDFAFSLIFPVIMTIGGIAGLLPLFKKAEVYKGRIIYRSAFKKAELKMSRIKSRQIDRQEISVPPDLGVGAYVTATDRAITFYGKDGRLFSFGANRQNANRLKQEAENAAKSLQGQRKNLKS